MAIRSGIRTYGAHHITSLAKTATSVSRIVKDYRPLVLAISEVGDWLASACDSKHTVKDLFLTLSKTQNAREAHNPLRSWDWNNLSAPQTSKLYEQKRILRLRSREETLHIEAHLGPSKKWVTILPLSYKKYNLSSAEWTMATRSRLRLNVVSVEKRCGLCKWSRNDLKGNHATMFDGGPSRRLRHNQ